MAIFNVIFYFLLYLTQIFASTSIDELIFPIYTPTKFILDWLASHPHLKIQHDVEKVRKLTPSDQNARLTNYSQEVELNQPVEESSNNHLVVLDFIGLVEKYPGYVAEEHFVNTSDGYKLTLHRLFKKYKNKDPQQKKVIFIKHGLFLSSDAYVLQGPEKDLAFLLAEQNYDIWLGNCRGNSYSRSHEYLFDNETDFWNFSFHEVALNDLTVFIDYILETTDSHDLTYIGYSIGATESYILLSKLPEYNQKIRLLISIAPFAFWNKPFDYDFSVNDIINKIKTLQNQTGMRELYPQSSALQLLSSLVPSVNLNSIDRILSSFFGEVPLIVDKTLYHDILSYVPAGTSTKTLLHLLQLIKSGNFEEYNDELTESVAYNITKINTPHAIFSGNNEQFLYMKNVFKLKEKFSDITIYNVRNPDTGNIINNLDFPWQGSAKHLYRSIIDLVNGF
ncbi:lipase 3 [Nasonia vitripennis]|uniref:Partial AB-hydrolase lipase domain-containing protein n=1 Tax=Nasonia vitripennis TaxID=7425 RepID=A0A7M7IPE3_NASVI|nr:lipase 3 [Nasonia vitripennis]